MYNRFVTKQQIFNFQTLIWNYYKKNKRDLPWRNTFDPYKILVSEVMLQQTQVPRVFEKYTEWITVFPNFESLAKAPLSEILKLWSGLGYNRRALYLQKTAQIIFDKIKDSIINYTELAESVGDAGEGTEINSWLFRDSDNSLKSLKWVREYHYNNIENEKDTTIKYWNSYFRCDILKNRKEILKALPKNLKFLSQS